LLSASRDKTIKLWDIDTNECIKTYEGHSKLVSCVKKGPGNIIISGDVDGQIKVWNMETCECIKTINEHKQKVSSILILSDNQFVSCSDDFKIKLFDFEKFNCVRTFNGHSNSVNDIDKITNNSIVSCSFDGTLKIWDLNNGECLKSILTRDYIYCMRVLSNEKIACSFQNEVNIWNIKTGICLNTLKVNNTDFYHIAKISNELIACGTWDGNIHIWNINNSKSLKTMQVHFDSRPQNQNKSEELIDFLDINSYLNYIIQDNSGSEDLMFKITMLTKLSKDLIISCSFDRSIKVSNIDTGICLKTLQGHTDFIYWIDLF